MASKPSRAEQVGATPAKLALIGVLGVVFIVVLCVQLGSSNEDLPPNDGGLSERRQLAADRTAGSERLEQAATVAWPEDIHTEDFEKWRPPELPIVIRHDPFALPASFPIPRPIGAEATLAQLGDQSAETIASLEEQVQQSRAELEALRHLGVQVVIRQDDGYVAMIGDRTIHVGDEIDGFTVIAIGPNGVRVARELKP